jgi:hypothetical protein
VGCFEEKAALRHPVFKPVDLPELQIGDDTLGPIAFMKAAYIASLPKR